MDFSQTKDAHLEQLMPMIKDHLANGNKVWFSPNGVSMRPMIRQGKDSVQLAPLPDKLNKYDLPLYQRDNGQYVLHRIVEVGETYTCVGDNQIELEPGVRYDQMIALVTAFKRGSKVISVNRLSYWIYCRYCHYCRPLRHLWRRGIGWLRRHFR